MSNPDKPGNLGNPDSLSLAPSSGDRKADFSDVQGGSNSTEVPASRPKADFGNVQSGSSSTEETIGEQSYTVQQGDTLSHIAKQFYGKANGWNRIFEANRDQLDDPDLIKPGQVLKIPADAD